jgi:hypothetical protein
MGRMLARVRPTPAMAVALAALVVALGGTGYAVTKIDGRSLQNRSVPAGKIKRNALTGVEINERRLARVPRAVVATRATTATTAELAGTAASAAIASSANNAEKLGGLLPSAYTLGGGRISQASLAGTPGGDDQTVLTVPGIGTVLADCGASQAVIRLRNDSGGTLTALVHDVDALGGTLSPASQVAAGSTVSLAASRTQGISTAALWSAQPATTVTLTVANVGCSISAQATASR